MIRVGEFFSHNSAVEISVTTERERYDFNYCGGQSWSLSFSGECMQFVSRSDNVYNQGPITVNKRDIFTAFLNPETQNVSFITIGAKQLRFLQG